MSIRTRWYTEDNKLGVDLNGTEAAIAVTTYPEFPANKINLGEMVQGVGGSRWMYVMASATVSANNLIAISPLTTTEFHAESLTSAHVASGIYSVGISQMSVTAAATGEAFWALLEARSGAAINCVSSCVAGAQLYLYPGQAGKITTTATGYFVVGAFAVNPMTIATATVDVVILREIYVTASA